MEMRDGGLSQGGEIVSEYSNAWIDMRHDNARNSACSVVLAEAQAEHDAADGPVLCAQAVRPRRRRRQPFRMAEPARRIVTLRSARCGGSVEWFVEWLTG